MSLAPSSSNFSIPPSPAFCLVIPIPLLPQCHRKSMRCPRDLLRTDAGRCYIMWQSLCFSNILKSSFFSRRNDSMSPQKFTEFSLLCSHLVLTPPFLLFMECRGIWQEDLVSPFWFWVRQQLLVPKQPIPHCSTWHTPQASPALSSPDSFPFLHPGIPSVSY